MRNKMFVHFMNIFVLSGILGISVEAHQRQMHQYFCQEAFKLLKKSFPDKLSEMASYLGTNENSFSTDRNERSWGAGTICSGAWDEDETDVVYHYGIGLDPKYDQWVSIPDAIVAIVGKSHSAYTSITHFWEADNGINAKVSISDKGTWQGVEVGWSFTIDQNAYMKIKKYETGGYYFREWFVNNDGITPKTFAFSCNNPPPYFVRQYKDLTMISLFDVYAGKTIVPYQYYDIYGYWHFIDCPSGPMPKSNAYEILGRMCHLLEDMSVPEHAHNDDHGCQNGLRCSYYENNEPNFYQWTAESIWNQGKKFINPFFTAGSNSDPIYNLMYVVNQVADHYASCSVNGNDNYDRNYYILSTIIPFCGAPTTVSQINDQNCRSMNDVLQPLTIRAVAGLMYWFACKTGQLTQIPSSDNINLDYLPALFNFMQTN